ncbi:MAG: stage II sporulation protein M [Prevotella sp.]|nr:stage II sporulation protein M [Prevotella sp.]
MKEVQFIRRNIEKWRNVEQAVSAASTQSPDTLADVYTDLTADLAFAQTHYPESRITEYLNDLALELHNEIYRNKKEKYSRIITYWTREVPQTMWEARRLLLVSLTVFIVTIGIGALSTFNDAEFARLILGDGYVDMTLHNIQNGNPMGVYGNDSEGSMFIDITLNNIGVSFMVFVLGIFTSVMSMVSLMYNGIMVGVFESFMYQQNHFWDAFLAINMHGVFELTAIVISGAAGLSLGNGMLFPGTYSRLRSFRMGAKRGMKIVIGTVPVFVVAGFIESFITRHTEWPDMVRLSFIIMCTAMVLFYYVYLPYKIGGRHEKQA